MNLFINVSVKVNFSAGGISVNVLFNRLKTPHFLRVIVPVLEPADTGGQAARHQGIDGDAGSHEKLGGLFKGRVECPHM